MSAFLGCTLPIEFGPARDVSGNLIDLTGATITCKARLKDGIAEIAAASASVLSGPAGTARAAFSAAQTASFAMAATYLYDAIATLPGGVIVALGSGSFVPMDLVSIDLVVAP